MKTRIEYKKELDILRGKIKTEEAMTEIFDKLDERYPGDHEIMKILITSEDYIEKYKEQYYELAAEYLDKCNEETE